MKKRFLLYLLSFITLGTSVYTPVLGITGTSTTSGGQVLQLPFQTEIGGLIWMAALDSTIDQRFKANEDDQVFINELIKEIKYFDKQKTSEQATQELIIQTKGYLKIIADTLPRIDYIRRSYLTYLAVAKLKQSSIGRNIVLLVLFDEINTILQSKESSQIAQVTSNASISKEEQEIITSRLKKCVIAQQQLFNDPSITEKTALNIGIAMSGGGYRATTLTGGYLKGLLGNGQGSLLDACSYISGLSGSTWFIAPLITHNYTIDHMINYLYHAIERGSFTIWEAAQMTPNDLSQFIEHVLLPRKYYNVPYTYIDIYGAMLGLALLKPFSETPVYSFRLSDQKNHLHTGNYPFPLYCAVSKKTTASAISAYDWFEFNPITVTNLHTKKQIPTWSFGRTFKNGISTNTAAEINLTTLMGVWGSAFSVGVSDIVNILERELKSEAALESLKTQANIRLTKIAALGINKLLETFASPDRITSAKFPNPFDDTKNMLELVDAGVDCNIAALPLFEKSRNLDAVIICDSSASVDKTRNNLPLELARLLELLEEQGYTYLPVSIKRTPTEPLVFADTKNKNSPVIIYVNYAITQRQITDLFAQKELMPVITKAQLLGFNYQNTSFMQTTNFVYSTENLEKAIGLGELAIKAAQPNIKKILRDLLKRKQRAATK